MTLGEFRNFTNHLDDNVELSYYYGGETIDIGAMDAIGDNKIVFASNNYGENKIEGCLRVFLNLKKQN